MSDQNNVISRRDDMITSSMAVGANNSAMQSKLYVKFVVNGLLHEAAYEGSCRYGDLQNLTYEAEEIQLKTAFSEFTKEMAAHTFHSAVDVLSPLTTHLYVQKGNPDIMLKDEQLGQLKNDAASTDVFVVVGGGIPQFTALRIAETYRKPVIIMQAAGWAIDAAAAIRAKGLDGWYVQNWEQLDQILRILYARKAIQQTRILSVTNFLTRPPRGVVSAITDFDKLKSQYGIKYENLNYQVFFKMMDQFVADEGFQKEADVITEILVKNAVRSNMTPEDVKKSVLFYLTAKKVMDQYDCNAFLIECFELCSSLNPWNRRFTPCLTNALLKDTGYPAACEHDTSALLTMMVEMYLSQKAIYMGNPDIDLLKNTITLHHSVASLKLMGLEKPDSPYAIRAFTSSGFGVTLRHDFDQDLGERVTAARFDPSGTKLLATSGKTFLSVGSGGNEGIGCAQNVTFRVDDARAFLRAQQNFGHHLAMVFGDYVEDFSLLGELMKFDLIVA